MRSLERAIGGIVHFKAVEQAAHVNAQGLPTSSLPSPFPTAASEVSNALVKLSEDSDMGYNPVAEAKELENIPGLSRYGSENREGAARGRLGRDWDG